MCAERFTFLSGKLNKNISRNICVTFWDMFDEGGGPSGHPADKGSRPAGQALVRQPEEVGHAVTDAPHQAGRTAQDLQRSHHPTWGSQSNSQLIMHFLNWAYTHFSVVSETFSFLLMMSRGIKTYFRVPSVSISSVLWKLLE